VWDIVFWVDFVFGNSTKLQKMILEIGPVMQATLFHEQIIPYLLCVKSSIFMNSWTQDFIKAHSNKTTRNDEIV
jgi:hypothetical protein